MTAKVNLPLVGGGQAAYLQVARAILSDVASDRYAVGSLLPTELEQCRRFGVSRFTVREAMRRLIEMGVVSRRKGVGTRVEAKRGESRYQMSFASVDEILQQSRETRLRVLDSREVVAEGKLCDLLRCKPGQVWLAIEAVRTRRGSSAPLAFIRIYMRPTFASVVNLILGSDVPVFQLIEQYCGAKVAEIQQEIAALPLAAPVAKILGVKAGFPGLMTVRHYLAGNGDILEVAQSMHRWDRFSYTMRLRLGS